MKIYILHKSLSDIKKPIVRSVYYTTAITIREFIKEMVEKNYNLHPIKESLEACIQNALDDFTDGVCYIINTTQGLQYSELNEVLNFSEEDEIMLVKLKLVRGIIW